MSRHGAQRRGGGRAVRLAGMLGTLVLGGPLPLAGQPAAAPAPGAEREEGLGAATRELDALRQARALGAPPGERSLPRVAVPELNPGGATGPTPPAPGATTARPGVNPRLGYQSDWLLEAMTRDRETEEQRKGRGGRLREANKPGEGVSRSDGAAREPNEPDHPEPSENRGIARRTDSEERVAAANPLSPFLADWMSPADRALLLPRASESDRGLGRRLGEAFNGTFGAEAFPPGSGGNREGGLIGDRAPGPANSPGINTAARPPPNPFLAGLEPLAPSSGNDPSLRALPRSPLPQPPPPLVSLPAAGAQTPGRPASQPVSPVPDFAKPKIDDKLFKPLKRF